MNSSHTADEVWFRNIRHVHTIGRTINPRGYPTKEILAHQSRVDMKFPCITHAGRRMGYRFMAAEAHWILSGDNRVETIRPYAKHIANFSDSGYVFQGAYGPRVTEQLRYVTEKLMEDQNSRQAVINIWRENPRDSKDIPCTLSLQFLLRRDEVVPNTLRLHCVATMRSSDLWLGWVYDVFNFSMISAWICLRLREMSKDLLFVDLGTLYLTAGSQHLYQINEEDAVNCTNSGETWRYNPMDLTMFNGPVSLMQHLVALRDKDWPTVGDKFFHELQHHGQ